jgi:endonuclease/exonuclease/phosphatase family metal-dependent hydrolase
MKAINLRNRKRVKVLAFGILGLVAFLIFIRAYTAINYSELNRPFFAGSFATENSFPVETLTIVSYNIWFGEDIGQALSELKEIQSQRDLDIVLLQEMDEVGTAQMARELKMNYVYFPAAIEPTYNKNFGNAILSRWPIANPQKLILPHKSFSNRMNRIATRATIEIPGATILVYSLHTESVFTLPRYRKEQYTAVLEDIDPEANLVIIGGDFNSFTNAAIAELEKDHKQAGFLRVSEGSGSTVVKYGIEMSSDHIFAKGFVLKEAGKMAGATASDHLPIWVTLIPQ